MRTMLGVVAAVASAACLLPLAAMAGDTPPTPASTTHQICSQQLASLGADQFGKTYGTNASRSNAMGKCIAKNASAGAADVNNAAKTCKAAQAADPAGFAKLWGSNVKAGSSGATKNALGKCISAAVKHSVDSQVAAVKSAMASCKAALKSDAATFAKTYGAGANALGKCVSAKAKTK